MSKAKATHSKSTPTKARVTFSDTTPSTPGSNTTSHTEMYDRGGRRHYVY